MSLDDLYSEAETELQLVSAPLFDLAVQHLAKRGSFLPFGATLESGGEVELHAAAGESDHASSRETLPRLHQGLRSAIGESTRVVAVCEWVQVTPDGGSKTDAIKVLTEHANGLTVAFYLPMRKRLFGKWEPGEMFVIGAESEIGFGSSPA